jgi:hypothetical protein
MKDRQHRQAARRRGQLDGRQLASGRRVDNLPAGRTEPVADLVGAAEVALPAQP